MARFEPVLGVQFNRRVGGAKKKGWRRKHLVARMREERERKIAYERAQGKFQQWLSRNPSSVAPQVRPPLGDGEHHVPDNQGVGPE